MNIKELKEAAQKATPGEWSSSGRLVSAVGSVDTWAGPVHGTIVMTEPCLQQDGDGRVWTARGGEEENAAYIALANPSTILSLIARCEKLDAIREAVAHQMRAGLGHKLLPSVVAALERIDAALETPANPIEEVVE